MLGIKPNGLDESVFVHPLAYLESKNIGANTRVWAFAHIMKDAQVGTGCNIGENVFIESGAVVGNGVTVKNQISIWDKVTVEDDVFLGPNVVFTNDNKPRSFNSSDPSNFLPTLIKKGASLGAAAVIVCGKVIGEFSFIAAGSVVTKDIPPYGYVKGNPARLSGYVCRCAQTFFTLEVTDNSCPRCDGKHPLI